LVKSCLRVTVGMGARFLTDDEKESALARAAGDRKTL